MDEVFIIKLKDLINNGLPGQEVQYRMAPAIRFPLPPEILNKKNPRSSGVMILLYKKQNSWHFVLMQRPSYNGPHSGQISLPGGKKEDTDKTIIDTACRESQEEIGIDPENIEVLGILTSLYTPPSNFCITPVVAWSRVTPVFILDPAEVAGLIEVSLDKLMNEENVCSKTMTLSDGYVIDTPYFNIDGHVVWGATAMMLNEFKYILKKTDNYFTNDK